MTAQPDETRLALSPVALPQCSFEESFEVTAAAGFRGIALRYDKLDAYLGGGRTIKDVRALLARFGLAFSEAGFLAEWQFHGGIPLVCGRRREGAPDEADHVLVERLRRFLGRCAELDCATVTAAVAVWESGDLDRAAEDFARLCDFAQEFGVHIGLEFIGEAPQVRDLHTAYRLVAAANRSNGGLVVDTFFVHQGGSTIADFEDVPIERILNVQLADAKDLPIGELRMLRDRLFPGQGAARVGEVVRLLSRRGYRGWWNVELFNPDFHALPAQDVARTAFETSREVLRRARADEET